MRKAKKSKRPNLAWLDAREFYEYCQAYRFAPVGDPAVVVAQFEALKRFIRRQLSEPV